MKTKENELENLSWSDISMILVVLSVLIGVLLLVALSIAVAGIATAGTAATMTLLAPFALLRSFLIKLHRGQATLTNKAVAHIGLGFLSMLIAFAFIVKHLYAPACLFWVSGAWAVLKGSQTVGPLPPRR